MLATRLLRVAWPVAVVFASAGAARGIDARLPLAGVESIALEVEYTYASPGDADWDVPPRSEKQRYRYALSARGDFTIEGRGSSGDVKLAGHARFEPIAAALAACTNHLAAVERAAGVPERGGFSLVVRTSGGALRAATGEDFEATPLRALIERIRDVRGDLATRSYDAGYPRGFLSRRFAARVVAVSHDGRFVRVSGVSSDAAAEGGRFDEGMPTFDGKTIFTVANAFPPGFVAVGEPLHARALVDRANRRITLERLEVFATRELTLRYDSFGVHATSTIAAGERLELSLRGDALPAVFWRGKPAVPARLDGPLSALALHQGGAESAETLSVASASPW